MMTVAGALFSVGSRTLASGFEVGAGRRDVAVAEQVDHRRDDGVDAAGLRPWGGESWPDPTRRRVPYETGRSPGGHGGVGLGMMARVAFRWRWAHSGAVL